MSSSKDPQAEVSPSPWQGLFFGSGVVCSLTFHGLLQERIMTVTYDTGYFQWSVMLVLINRVLGSIYALVMISARGESLRPAAPFWKYLAMSVSNVSASTCQYEALKYVSFPTQMVAKSFKIMPVLLWGMIISGKRYRWTEWLQAFIISGGLCQFLLLGNVESLRQEGDSFIGVAILAAFLALDGFTSSFQEKLFRDHKTSTYNQMLWVNISCACFAIGTIVITQTATQAVGFLLENPLALQHALLLGVVAALSQWFIYSQVKAFGAVVLAMTLNVRQVTSVLVSYWIYGHHASPMQIIGLALVFGCLICRNLSRSCTHASCCGMCWSKTRSSPVSEAAREMRSTRSKSKDGLPEEIMSLSKSRAVDNEVPVAALTFGMSSGNEVLDEMSEEEDVETAASIGHSRTNPV